MRGLVRSAIYSQCRSSLSGPTSGCVLLSRRVVIPYPQPEVPRGILEPRSDAPNPCLGGILIEQLPMKERWMGGGRPNPFDWSCYHFATQLGSRARDEVAHDGSCVRNFANKTT